MPWNDTDGYIVAFSYFSPYFYANDFALSQGVPPHVATYATAILNAGSFTGRALSGPMAERYGVIEVFIGSGVAGGITVLALWSSRAVGTAGSIIGLYLYGLFGGELITPKHIVQVRLNYLPPRRRHRPCRGMLRSDLSRTRVRAQARYDVDYRQSASPRRASTLWPSCREGERLHRVFDLQWYHHNSRVLYGICACDVEAV